MAHWTMGELEKAANALELPDKNEADWLGRLNKIIRDLSDMKRAVMDELPGPVTGSEYAVVEARSASRSYNSAAILSQFRARNYDLHDLMGMDAVRLTWRWTQLKRAAEQANVDLHIAHHEIEETGDIEGPLVGEVWASRYNIEGVKE